MFFFIKALHFRKACVPPQALKLSDLSVHKCISDEIYVKTCQKGMVMKRKSLYLLMSGSSKCAVDILNLKLLDITVSTWNLAL